MSGDKCVMIETIFFVVGMFGYLCIYLFIMQIKTQQENKGWERQKEDKGTWLTQSLVKFIFVITS